MAVNAPAIGALLGHYRLVEEIGKGGMGVVFRARDEQLERDVAIKVLPPGTFPDESARKRFRREARVLAKLNHPNIALAFDFGQQNGIDYLVTEYVPGITLDAKLEKGPLPEKNIIDIGIQLAKGLAAAHREQVVHLDLKPGNLRLTAEGELKILDFGLARWRESTGSNATTLSTAAEEVVGGTLPYMAPEQIRSEEIDARTDIWAAGAVLYEMATGERPFPAIPRLKLLNAIQNLDPPPPSTRNRQISKSLDAVVLKALDKDPGRRYQSARELGVDLLRLLPTSVSTGRLSTSSFDTARRARPAWAAIVILALLSTYVGYRFYSNWADSRIRQYKLLAVLPIDSNQQDDKTAALITGLTETLTTKLADPSTKGLQLISARDLQELQVKTPDQAWRELGADLVLEGTAHRVGDQIRINCSLVDARTHRQIAARSITATMTDVIGLEDEVSNQVASLISPIGMQPPTHDSARLATKPDAYASYLRALGYLQEYQKPENIELAIAEFRIAIALDPAYAAAYAGLGEAHLLGYQQMNRGVEWVDQARKNCSESLQLRETPEGLICSGDVDNATGKYDSAVQRFQRAVQINPNDVDGVRGEADAFAKLGDSSSAEKAYQQAISLEGNYWGVYSWLGTFYSDHARYSDAIRQFEKVIELAPSNYRGYSNLGAMYVLEGKYAEALVPLNNSINIRPNFEAFNNLGNAYFQLRRYSEAATAFQNGLNLDDSDWMLWGNLGDSLFWSGERKLKARAAYQNAIVRAEKKLEVNPKDALVLAFLADYNAMNEQRSKAVEYIDDALTVAPEDGEVRLRAAIVYNHFGDSNRCLATLQKAITLGYSTQVIWDTPDFDHLHNNSRFRTITKHL